jgi:uncharacterized membrane protein YfcA
VTPEIGYLIVGVVAGIFSGLLGIGGGMIVVPALVFFFHMTQHKAQGTILAAFLLPVAFLGFWRYWQAGNADLRVAAFLAVGLFIGAWFGAGLSLSLPEVALKRVFGVFLLAMACKYLFAK